MSLTIESGVWLNTMRRFAKNLDAKLATGLEPESPNKIYFEIWSRYEDPLYIFTAYGDFDVAPDGAGGTKVVGTIESVYYFDLLILDGASLDLAEFTGPEVDNPQDALIAYLEAQDATFNGTDDDDTLIWYDAETINAGAGDDEITSDAESVLVYAGDGDDVITGLASSMIVHGEGGDDLFGWRSRADGATFCGGEGEDVLVYTGKRSDLSVVLREDGGIEMTTPGDPDAGPTVLYDVETFRINGKDIAFFGPPLAQGESGSTGQGQPFSIAIASLLSNDVSALDAILSLVEITNPSNGTVEIQGDRVVFTPDEGFRGEAGFDYVISNGAAEATAHVSIDVTKVGDPPVAQDDAFTLLYNGTVSGNVFADNGSGPDTDPDGDSLQISGLESYPATITLPSGARLTIARDGTFSYDTNGAFDDLAIGKTAIDHFSYYVSDGWGNADHATVRLTLTKNPDEVPDAPPVTDPEATLTQRGVASEISVAMLLEGDASPGGSALVFEGVRNAVHGSVELDGDVVRFTPQAGYVGLATFDYVVSNAAGETVQTVSVSVIDGNRAPSAQDDVASIAEDEILAIDFREANGGAADSDPNGDALSVVEVAGIPVSGLSPVTLPSGAVLTPQADGSFLYDPAGAFDALGAGESAVDSFDYTLSDALGATDTASVSIEVEGAQAPIRGGAGDDKLRGNGWDDEIYGHAGEDVLRGRAGDDMLVGGRGADVAGGGRGEDDISGNRGGDLLRGGKGADTLSGGKGSDALLGGGGADELRGGRGQDKLVGGAGDNHLAGGKGGDLFVISTGDGLDVIEDFGRGADLLHIKGLDGGFEGLLLVEDGRDLLIGVDGGFEARLLGVSLEDIDAADFL